MCHLVHFILCLCGRSRWFHLRLFVLQFSRCFRFHNQRHTPHTYPTHTHTYTHTPHTHTPPISHTHPTHTPHTHTHTPHTPHTPHILHTLGDSEELPVAR